MRRSSALAPLLLVTVCLSVGGSLGEAAVKPLDNTTLSKPALPTKFHCIVCDDLKNEFCEPWDHFSHSKNCLEDDRIDKTRPIGCRKMIQTIADKTYVSRQCTNLVEENVQGCIDRVGTRKIKVVYCHCRTPDCNAGHQVTGSWALHLLLPVTLWALIGAR